MSCGVNKMKNYKKKLFLLSLYIRIIFLFFTANIYGIFILLVVLYLTYSHLTGVKPLNHKELIIWISEQSETMKALFLSSLMTIVGFVIAFQSATKNWKDQIVANMGVQASDEIDMIYARITELIESIKIYSDLNLDELNKIKNGEDPIKIKDNIVFILSKTDKFISERQELTLLRTKALQLRSRYSQILSLTPNANDLLVKINDKVIKVSKKMWIVVPYTIMDTPNYLNHYSQYRYCQLDCVKFFSANFLRKGRFLGTCPMGFFLQLTSIFTQTKASSV